MKILLTAINAKYIHSNLAVYSLKAYAQSFCNGVLDIELAEYTINQQEDEMLQDIYGREADVLCISCYIWNLMLVERLVRDIKKVCPAVIIWLGGPEVSYDAVQVLERLPEVTGVMKGEGEQTFAELCKAYVSKEGMQLLDTLLCLEGVAFRDEQGQVKDNPWRLIMNMDELPFVYEDLAAFQNKIIYYESSRGCPFSCSYCLSSIDKQLRYRELSLIKKELQFFIDHKVAQVKFVDRTFNCSHTHAYEIWSYINEHDNGVTNFHFEISADLLNEKEIQLIKTLRPGLVQFEIGVQSTNPITIREINRTMQFDKVRQVVEEISADGNVHQHLDLIAGLPFEDIQSFARSFNDVYLLKPQQLQLGFLKVLKGSCMAEKSYEYGLVYKDAPPYEMLFTKWVSYEDTLELKGVEAMVEVYYNSGQFTHTLEAMVKDLGSPYGVFCSLSKYTDTYHRASQSVGAQHKRSKRYEILLSYIQSALPAKVERYRELLVLDYYLRENAKTRPEFAGEYKVDKLWLRAFYEAEEKNRKYLVGYEQYDRNQMRKMTHVEKFRYLNRTILFDYLQKNALNQEARTYMIEESECIEG